MKILKQIFNIYTLIVISIYSVLLYIYFNHFDSSKLSDDNDKWGTFGDFFGGTLSPIIGILSIYLTYKIIYKQSEESDQNEFKNMFQILFQSLPEEKKEISINKLVGDKAILKLNSDFKLYFEINSKKDSNIPKNHQKNIENSFLSIKGDAKDSFGPFMKNLHNMLKFIDSYCADNRKSDYADLLRAQFNSHELLFIFYNAIGSTKHSKFKNRLIKFDFLKDIKDDNSIDPDLRNLFKVKQSKYPINFSVWKYHIRIEKNA
ncbi:MAG: hypothetical protein BGO88_15505 [Flavobacterium sp. 38-13]|nr:MAG: hypothetical protein BGO88_15505 [Flavobacterium sp. 38-13]